VKQILNEDLCMYITGGRWADNVEGLKETGCEDVDFVWLRIR
jgi:hypothetical protein